MSAWTVPQPSPSDPGRATGTGRYVEHPRCRCGEAWSVHAIRRDKTRGACSRSGCGCRVYEPEEGSDAA